MKSRILFVDDETHVLDGIRRMLRAKRNEWEMAFAHSGDEALAILAAQPYEVIVSDMRMPGMDGHQLLSTVRERFPLTIRFILSGHADQALIHQCMESTHQYLSKPCEPEQLINTIDRTLAIRSLLRKDGLAGLISQIRCVPSLPDLYLQVSAELKSPNASIQRVGQIISKDIGLCAKVLQLVNSAFFGMRRHVVDPAQAASLLGADILKSVVLMAQVFDQMKTVPLPGWTQDTLWGHSLQVALCAQAIARQAQVDKRAVDDAFLSGLFHDLGQLLLASNLPDPYRQVLTQVSNGDSSLRDAEQSVFEATHEEVGAYLLGLWGFSDSIVEAAAFHHHPGDCVGRSFGSLTAVHVANVEANRRMPSHPGAQAMGVDAAYLRAIGCQDLLPAWRKVCEEIFNQGGDEHGSDPVRG